MKLPNLFNKPKLIQPILTVILIVLVAALIFQFFKGRGTGQSNDGTLRQIDRVVTFDEAAKAFFNNSYEVQTRGALIVKDRSTKPSSTPTPTSPTTITIPAVENKYNDMAYFLDKGDVKRLDFKTYGSNESIFFDKQGNIIYLSNTGKAYTKYPIPADSETSALIEFTAKKELLKITFPFVSLLKDYQDKKFNPIERARNLYSGKWQHPLFTSDEVVNVFIETDAQTGLFSSFIVHHSFATTFSEIYFDFRPYDNTQALDLIPEGYKEVPVQVKYKIKS